MSNDKLNESRIVASWQKNAVPWIKAIDEGEIESRRLVTDQAIVDAITQINTATVLDVGCGEGWLTRALAAKGMAATGIDAIASLITKARESDDADFHCIAYEDLDAQSFNRKFDLAVCNFSLFGKESVENLCGKLKELLIPNGYFVVQTLHPAFIDDTPYQEGWRESSWDGFSDDFSDPAPWYFRTLAAWLQLYINHGFLLEQIIEPVHPKTGKAASLILVGRAAR